MIILLTIYLTGVVVWFTQSMIAGAYGATLGKYDPMTAAEVRNSAVTAVIWPVAVLFGLCHLLDLP
jgi:phosphotransferase system  glucose/maltose/N-acetylglucosamine-specific IIC component